MHATQQSAQITTGTQLKFVYNVQLTRRSLAWPTVRVALIPSVVAPRLRATGLPCIASPETMSSGNTQHLGTENNRFIDASTPKLIFQWSRGQAAHTVRLNNMYII